MKIHNVDHLNGTDTHLIAKVVSSSGTNKTGTKKHDDFGSKTSRRLSEQSATNRRCRRESLDLKDGSELPRLRRTAQAWATVAKSLYRLRARTARSRDDFFSAS